MRVMELMMKLMAIMMTYNKTGSKWENVSFHRSTKTLTHKIN